MERYEESLGIAIKNKNLFDRYQKLEIAIQITIGLNNLHSGETKISHNDF
jgi:hypothetical protein